jgi:hypothetical protein
MAAVQNHPVTQSVQDTVTNGKVSAIKHLFDNSGIQLIAFRHRICKRPIHRPILIFSRARRTERKSRGCEDEQ